jgi:ATP-dependent helicase Lhr and Lhr-like helicase
VGFDRLHIEVRRWIREQGWTGLRPIQEAAIRAVLDGPQDVVVMAGTASGKTEAAFLPLLSQIADDPGGIRIIYVSPLKALINDQHRRLELLCERLDLPLVKWHGDAAAGPKARVRKRPEGVVLITPESIEALLIRRPADAARMFGGLRAIVIDELHAFLQGPRGLHLACLLRRIDEIAEERPRRIGLSATLGAPDMARAWLNPARPEEPVLLQAGTSGPSVKLQIRGYEKLRDEDGVDQLVDGEGRDALSRIADHLFAHLRGTNNLVFAGSRRTVEALADRLRQRSGRERVPEEFFPHHGSLSKELREELELRLKEGILPTTAVATTTLELGIDLGAVRSVAQVGAPKSLASLKQRLGRSGRRGEPAILRIYVREEHLTPASDPLDRLRLGTVRAVAAVRLLKENFVEPPVADPALATVVLHQTLSSIASKGGLKAAALHRSLFGPGSALEIAPAEYAALLRGVGSPEPGLLEQSPDGLLMLGAEGERLVGRRDFYAVFQTDQEWRLVTGGRTLGSVPITNVLGVGSLVGFAGRRWRVEAVDEPAMVLEVIPHPSGKLPLFDPLSGEAVHDRLSGEMLVVLTGQDVPAFLDPVAKEFLQQARAAFQDLNLHSRDVIAAGRDTYILTWKGTAINDILGVLLRAAGLETEALDFGVAVADCSPDEVRKLLASVEECPPIEDLASYVSNLRHAKLDEFIGEDVLRRLWTRRNVHLNAPVTGLLRGLRY